MKSVYALIPAALLAGTVLSVPVEAKRAEVPGVHAERLSAKQKYFKPKVAKRPGKITEVVATKAHRTKRVASMRKAVSETGKTANLKPRNLKLAINKKRASISVAEPKQAEIKARKIAHIDSTSMTRVLRSGPRELKKLAGV